MSGASNDDRPPMAVAMQWVYQITAIGLEMALPAWLGHWLDERWGTEPWLVACGGVLGFTLAMWHLLGLTKRNDRHTPGSRGPSKG